MDQLFPPPVNLLTTWKKMSILMPFQSRQERVETIYG